MSSGYASRLSEYPNKGICGLNENFDSSRVLKKKLHQCLEILKKANYITFLTGAGISTSAGIPDFRGPNGIWTKEKNEEKLRKKKNNSKKRKLDEEAEVGARDDSGRSSVDNNIIQTTKTTAKKKLKKESDGSAPKEEISFEKAKPALTHEILTSLIMDIPDTKFKYVVTQNVDGLHRRSGLSRDNQSVLHGCIFTEYCPVCKIDYFRDFDVGGLSRAKTGRFCTSCKPDDNNKDGVELRDTILDWEDELPEPDWEYAQDHCELSDVVIALGTSLRIEPAASLIKMGTDKSIVVNLQKTPYDDRVDVVVRQKVDEFMSWIYENLYPSEWKEFCTKREEKARPKAEEDKK